MNGFQKWLIGILLLSALLRITWFTTGELIPVIWDARRHAAGALGVISYFDAPQDELTAPEGEERDRQDRYRLKYYYDRYIQGEPIVWEPYSPPTLTEARDAIFFTGPLYPSILAAVFFAAPTADISLARFLGVIFDIITNLLLILTAVRLIGRKGALLAGFFYAVYFPFIQTSTMLLLETSTSLWMMLSLFLFLKGHESTRPKHFTLAGIACGLLILNKPTAIFLFVPLIIGYYAYASKEVTARILLRRVALFMLPVIVALVGWTMVASLKYGQFTLRQPGYAGANLRQSTSIKFEGYDLDWVESNFWERSVGEDILDDPFGFAGLMVKKLERLWSRPYNDYQKSFLVPATVMEYFHIFLVISGLFGLVWLWFDNWRRAVWPILMIGYYTSIHTIFHSVSRYHFNAIPFLIIASAGFIVVLYEWYRAGEKNLPGRVVAAFLLITAGLAFDDRWIADSYLQAIMLETIKIILIIAGVCLLGRTINQKLKARRSLAVTIVIALIIPLVTTTKTLSRDSWADFDCRLDNQAMKVGTRLYVSRLYTPKEDEILAVLIDMNSAPGRRNTFTVGIGDIQTEYVQGQKPLIDYFYPKKSYDIFSLLVPVAIEEFRQWAIIPVDPQEILAQFKKYGYLDISVAINSRFAEPNNVVYVYGNKNGLNKKHYAPGIRYTSIERYVHRGDPRIRFPIETVSDSSKSYYIPRSSTPGGVDYDLSDQPGEQNGRYNIYLIHFTANGDYYAY